MAVMLALLAPAATRQRARMAGLAASGAWVEVCAQAGTRWIRLDASADEAPGAPPGEGTHEPGCAWCAATGADRMGAPPVAVALLVLTPAVARVNLPDIVRPLRQSRYAFAPRGPPLLS